jgi:hypothetical protein
MKTMKKVLLVLVAGAFMSTSLISCNKCGRCTTGGVAGPEYCQKDDRDAYDAYKETCESGGGTWDVE